MCVLNEISVIIPCYNAEKTIRSAIRSLEQQTYRNFDVIVVDDGSNDNTLGVIKEISNETALNIIVIHQNNGGVSSARNRALSAVETKYVTFLDADDKYEPDCLQTLFDVIQTYNADIAVGKINYVNFKKNNDFSRKTDQADNHSKTELIEKYELLDLFMERKKNRIGFSCAIYKASIIKENDIVFPQNLKYSEDTQFLYSYIYFCNTGCAVIDKNIYQYIITDNSATKNVSIDMMQTVEAFKNSAKVWMQDESFTPKQAKYMISRSIWAVAKDFAATDRALFEEIQRAYDVRAAMVFLSKNSNELYVKLGSIVFLINKRLFAMLAKIVMR